MRPITCAQVKAMNPGTRNQTHFVAGFSGEAGTVDSCEDARNKSPMENQHVPPFAWICVDFVSFVRIRSHGI